MTPNLLPVYFFSAALISLLGFFARHNKRTGWVKPGQSKVPDLIAMQAEWRSYRRLSNNEPAQIPTLPGSTELAEFTSQLSFLHGALGSTTVKPTETRKEEPVKV